MRKTIGELIQLSPGVNMPAGVYGNCLLLQPSYFTKAGDRHHMTYNVVLSEKLEKYLLVADDILFTAKGWEHTAFLYTDTLSPAVPSSAFIAMRIIQKDKVLPLYLLWFLNLPATKKRLSVAAKGTSMPSLSLRDLAAFPVPVPALSVQQSIIRIAELQNRKERLEADLRLASSQHLQSQLLTIATLEL